MNHIVKNKKYRKERVVFSDVLPYETPIIFSNKHFYDFLLEYEVSIAGDNIEWIDGGITLTTIIKLLFDFQESTTSNPQRTVSTTDGISNLRFELAWGLRTIPFNFKIAHKESDFRVLSVIHPKNHLAVVEFYNKYSFLILYFCKISNFSIRKPYSIAKIAYKNDELYRSMLSKTSNHELVEQSDFEYLNLKTFFSYQKYNNVYKFYESYKYHRCEKKYEKMFKFDIAKCFDSIYTHSITWALLNKDIVKATISSGRKNSKTFGDAFDKLMQDLNYGETNGIVIGPEFSRIFAELILQQIDKKVFAILKKEQIVFKIDYEIFRYVDDYFVFYNTEKVKSIIIEKYNLYLREFKLSFNDSKTILYSKPIITEITIAKQKISYLLNTYLPSVDNSVSDGVINKLDVIELYTSSNKLITKFKTIIKETNIEYKDIMNYTLSSLDNRVEDILQKLQKIQKTEQIKNKITNMFFELLDFTFFIYSVSAKVNSTIKLCMILSKIIHFVKEKENSNFDQKHLVLKKIYDDTFLMLQKNKSSSIIQVETLYLLVVLSEMGKEYRLDPDVLSSYFGIENLNQPYKFNIELNYFSIVVLLFYIKNIKRYDCIKNELKKYILSDKFNNFENKNTEATLLLFDCLSCPFLDEPFKIAVLNECHIQSLINNPTNQQLQDIIKFRKYWFIEWTNFDIIKALRAKKSKEMYS